MADHLEDLLKDTPMGRMKLLAAWDSLSTETQIRLLTEMSAKGRTGASDRPIWLKALSSPSEYIRYLVAREVRYPRDDEIEDKVAADTSPLVRYAQARGMTLFLDLSNEDFDRCPREQKLAIVSNDDPPNAAKFAHWVEHAVETKSVSEDEMYDVVLEYLSNPKLLELFQEETYDFFADREADEGFKALWELVPKIPLRVAHCLVGRLSWDCVLSHEPPSEVLAWLEASPCLDTLLLREDAPLMELRRQVFFSTDPKYQDSSKCFAVTHDFFLTPNELHELFKQNSKLLQTLASFSRSLSPVMLLALKDSVSKQGTPINYLTADGSCERHFKSALAKLNGGDLRSLYGKDQEIRFLKVYHLASQVMPWSESEPTLGRLPEPLRFLSDKVVKGDTWATFIEFANEVANPRFDHLLPRLEEVEDVNVAGAAPVTEAKGASDLRENEKAIEATPSQPERPQGRSALRNTIIIFGILAALLTFLFAVGGILDNEYRNFGSGVIAMAISAGAIVFAGSRLFRS